MGWVLNTDLGGSRFRRKSPELGAAEHEEVRGPHGWSLTLNSDRCLISGFQPTPGPAPRLILASHPAVLPSPPPSRLQARAQFGQWVHTPDPFLISRKGHSLRPPLPSPPLPSPPPPPSSKNSEKLEGLADSPPQAGAAGWNSWEDRT